MKIVVTGCARSGTGYVAELLRRCGIRCGHEAVFRPDGFAGWGHYQADSSWLALPQLSKMSDVLVVHFVRHPVRVARSKARFFAQGADATPYHAAIARVIPDVFSTRTDPLERFTYYWVAWNRLIAARSAAGLAEGRLGAVQMSIEAFNGLHAEVLSNCLRLFGFDVSESTVRAARDSTPTNFNAHARPDPRALEFGWEDLVKTQVGDELIALAREYGYTDDRKVLPW